MLENDFKSIVRSETHVSECLKIGFFTFCEVFIHEIVVIFWEENRKKNFMNFQIQHFTYRYFWKIVLKSLPRQKQIY